MIKKHGTDLSHQLRAPENAAIRRKVRNVQLLSHCREREVRLKASRQLSAMLPESDAEALLRQIPHSKIASQRVIVAQTKVRVIRTFSTNTD